MIAGISSINSLPRNPCSSSSDKAEIDLHQLEDESDSDNVELLDEFRPLEHPVEPLGEDWPANWPLPDCSLLDVNVSSVMGDEGIWKKPAKENANLQLKDGRAWKEWLRMSFWNKSEPSEVRIEENSVYDLLKSEGSLKDGQNRSFRKRTKSPAAEDGIAEVSQKRHHRPTIEIFSKETSQTTANQITTSSPSSSRNHHQSSIFQVFQPCKEFGV